MNVLNQSIYLQEIQNQLKDDQVKMCSIVEQYNQHQIKTISKKFLEMKVDILEKQKQIQDSTSQNFRLKTKINQLNDGYLIKDKQIENLKQKQKQLQDIKKQNTLNFHKRKQLVERVQKLTTTSSMTERLFQLMNQMSNKYQKIKVNPEQNDQTSKQLIKQKNDSQDVKNLIIKMENILKHTKELHCEKNRLDIQIKKFNQNQKKQISSLKQVYEKQINQKQKKIQNGKFVIQTHESKIQSVYDGLFQLIHSIDSGNQNHLKSQKLFEQFDKFKQKEENQ